MIRNLRRRQGECLRSAKLKQLLRKDGVVGECSKPARAKKFARDTHVPPNINTEGGVAELICSVYRIIKDSHEMVGNMPKLEDSEDDIENEPLKCQQKEQQKNNSRDEVEEVEASILKLGTCKGTSDVEPTEKANEEVAKGNADKDEDEKESSMVEDYGVAKDLVDHITIIPDIELPAVDVLEQLQPRDRSD
ncbi:hypothetical protein M5689_004245 [Euphorbia peplus]|nr:hypothetical protein M5689_004245 [Euphorbia peplus]